MAPEIVGRYELLRRLGAGGMGEVFLARDQTLGRQVAVKRVHAGDERAAKYILHEARVVASLDHPNIAAVYDVVEHDGQPHIVMEYVDGTTLAARMSAGPMAEDQAIDYGRQIASALAYAHSRNVVHCDIKPSNVMVTASGVPKVLDFGIARRDSTTSHDATTTTQAVIGTPPYMAPEVLLGAPPSQQSDVFGLGVMMYELLSGRRPYEGRGAAAVLQAMTVPAPALDSSIAGISPEISAVVARAIETDPKLRLPSAEEFKSALDRIAAGETATVNRPVRRSAAGKSIALLAALAIVCTALVTGIPRVASRATKQSVLGVMFFNNTGQAENDYLAAGMSDVLLSHLAGAPGVTVVARTAMPSLTASTQVPEAVKALGLTHVLTGSVQRSGNSLRLTIGLVDRSGELKWSQSVDGVVSDVFHLEARVSEAALSGLRSEGLVVNAIVQQARERPPTNNPDAFDDYAHGRALIERGDVPGNIGSGPHFL